MAVSKKNARNNAYKLKGKLRKDGFDRWRFFFNGQSKTSGEERCFYIELYILNPLVSPSAEFFGFKPEETETESLQNVLASTSDESADSKQPSYVAVRAGELGRICKQVNSFYPAKDLLLNKKKFGIKLGNCVFSDTSLQGAVSLDTESKLRHCEYFSDSGSFSWDIKYEKQIDFETPYLDKSFNWSTTGTRTLYSGTFTADGEEFTVLPKPSAGYADKNWGSNFPLPWFYVASSNLTSIITGKTLSRSCFAIEGCFSNKLCAYTSIEGNKLSFIPGKAFHTYSVTWECTEAPADEEGKKLHWSASIHDKHFIIDIDIFCKTDELFVRDYEIPDGHQKLFKVLSGGTGTGEIRFYKNVNRSIELIEHAHISHALCEYGAEEKQVK